MIGDEVEGACKQMSTGGRAGERGVRNVRG